MAFFGTPQPQMMPEDEYPGLIPTRQQGGGILGFLRNPAVSAALGGMSRGFTQAALAGAPTGQGFAAGLAGGAEGVGSWEEAQAKAAAERVNKLAASRQGETDYRYQLGLIARRYMRDEGMSEQDALIKAQEDMANRSFEQRGQLADKSYQNQLSIKYLEDQLAKGRVSYEQAMRLANEPDIAAAIERERLKVQEGADAEKTVRTGENTVAVIGEIKSLIPKSYVGGGMNSINRALTSVGMAPDDEKAQNTAKIQALATQLKFMAKPPGLGTMTDSEWRIITDAIGDPTTGDKGTYAAALDALRYAIEGRMPPDSVRRAYGGIKEGGKSGKHAAPAKPSGIRIDAQGRIIK